MRLILTRHGETIENKEGIIQGQLHGKLSPEGIIQAKKVALRLKDEKIDFIYSSDLKRAVDTTNEIARFHNKVPIEFIPELRERNLGEFQGRKKSEFGWDSKELKATILEPKKGENREELCLRAKNLFEKIFKKHPRDNILLVGHNGINKAIIATIIRKTHDELKDIENQLNTSICIFEINEDRRHNIHTFNCIKHLK